METSNVSLVVVPTFQCSAACDNCGTFSTPRVRGSLDRREIFKVLDDAFSAGIRQVVFSGGEATLRWRDLIHGIRHATENGMASRLVTNAWWAVDIARAKRRAIALVNAGLNEINFSTGDEHARFVPLRNVTHAIVATSELGLRPYIMVELTEKRIVSKDLLLADLATFNSDVFLADDQVNESPWMPVKPMQRGCYSSERYLNSENVYFKRGCDSVLSNYVVHPNKRIAACCGLGIRSVPEIFVARATESNSLAGAILEAEGRRVLKLIKTIGPERILFWLSEIETGLEWQNLYAHQCQSCVRLFRDPKVLTLMRENLCVLEKRASTETQFLDSVAAVRRSRLTQAVSDSA